jgi:acetylornithine/N-succinyldiaminopimelate aminotransferase
VSKPIDTFADTSALMQWSTKPDAVMMHGTGSWLWDQRNRRYLDFVQGWAVNCLGHSPEVVLRALREQASTLIHASPAYHNAPSIELARELTSRAGLAHAFFCSTGAEANEGAIKLARKWGSLRRQGAFEIITTTGSFHGRTLATMAASGKPGFAGLFPPAIQGFVHVPFGDLAALERAINERTVAVMIEPIQGEGGVNVPPPDYLSGLRALSTARGLLLILDEVQTGMGRTGKLFAHEHAGVRPDILTLGKGLGAGIPIAAVLSDAALNVFEPGDQGGTFSNHPLLCAVSRAVLHELCSPGFLDRVCSLGARLSSGLTQLAQRYGLGEVRGLGLLWALALPQPVAADVVEAAFERGLLINAPQPSLLRFMPALNVTDSEIDAMLALLSTSLGDVLGA